MGSTVMCTINDKMMTEAYIRELLTKIPGPILDILNIAFDQKRRCVELLQVHKK